MTVATSHNRKEYIGDNIQLAFPYDFLALDQTHFEVYLDGVLQALTTDYTVDGIGFAVGGNITFLAAPGVGVEVLILRVVPETQPVDLPNTGPFPSATVEAQGLDRIVMMVQQLSERIGRTIKLTTDSLLEDITIGDPGALKFLRWNAAGDAIEPADLPAQSVATVDQTNGFPKASLPAGQPDGSLAHVTDDIRGLWMKFGNWAPVSAGFVNTEYFGGADIGARFNAAVAALGADVGGTIVIPPGDYLTSTELNLSVNAPVSVWAYGVTIRTTGAISGMKIIGGSTTRPRSVYGLKIDHRDNAAALYGFNVVGAWNCRLYDCTVVANGVSGTYGAFRVGNTDPAVGSTGSFWTVISNCWVRKNSGGDAGDITFGVIIEGNGNATTVRGGGLNNCTTGVIVRNQGAAAAIPNSTIVDGVAFEGGTTGIHLTGPAASNVSGLRIVNNRFETHTTMFSATGVTANYALAPYLAGNSLVGTITYLNNPEGQRITTWDFIETPPTPISVLNRGVAINALGGTEHALELNTATNSARGIRVLASGVFVGNLYRLVNSQSVERIVIGANTGGLARVELDGIRGLSGATGAPRSNNLRGVATFVSAGTVAVSFAGNRQEQDTNYWVWVAGAVDENFWVTAKATGGFTINSSNASSTAVVNWLLIR